VAKEIGLPMSYAAVFFVQASLWGLVLLQYKFFWPAADAMRFPLSVPEIRKLWPEPLPLPDGSPIWNLVWAYGFLAPFVAGWLTGRKALTGAARSVATVQILCTLLTFIVGTFMLPITEGLWFAILQLAWWVPMGTLTAHIASAFTRRRRFRFQPNWRKKS
jgi:hypothetical protein